MPGIPYPFASLTIRLATQEEMIKIRKGTFSFSQWARRMALERYLNLEASTFGLMTENETGT